MFSRRDRLVLLVPLGAGFLGSVAFSTERNPWLRVR
jgi:hypothetical protein